MRFDRYIILVLLLSAGVANAAIKYVATTGFDTTGDGSIGNPWGTIRKGIQSMARSDTLYLRGGIYTERSIINADWKSGNSPSSPTTISSYPGEWAVFRSTTTAEHALDASQNPPAQTLSNIVLSSWAVDLGFRGTASAINHVKLRDAKNVTFTNMWFQNNPHGNGVQFSGSSNMIVIGCVFTNFAQYKYTTGLADGKPIYTWKNTNCVYASNIFTDTLHGAIQLGTTSDNKVPPVTSWEMFPRVEANDIGRNNTGVGTTHGIFFQDAMNALVINNVIRSATLSGMKISGDNNRIFNNTIYDAGKSSWGGIEVRGQANVTGGDANSTGNWFVNNAVWNSPLGLNIAVANASRVLDCRWTNNLANKWSGVWLTHAGSIRSGNLVDTIYDPDFVSAPSNLMIQSSGYAWQRGVSLNSVFTKDLVGTIRADQFDGLWDIGVYEIEDGVEPPTTPPVQIQADGPYAYEVGLVTQTFTFTRSGSAGAVTVHFTITGTAVAGTHYVGFANEITFSEGVATAQIVLTPLTVAGDDDTTVILTLVADPGEPDTYTVSGFPSATITIRYAPITEGGFVTPPGQLHPLTFP